MIELRKYFLEKVTENSTYYKHKKYIESDFQDYAESYECKQIVPEVSINELVPDDFINEFKNLILPRNNYSNEDNFKFLLICFYLNEKGYYIDQFPNFLKNPIGLEDFAYYKIRNHLILKKKDRNGNVAWRERKLLIQELNLLRNNSIPTCFNNNIEEIFEEISIRGSTFDNMTNKEKLKEIANFLEHILKENKVYREINEVDTLNLISNSFIKEYRQILQCYRHANDESIDQRNKLEEKELFLIHLGIAIIHGIHKLT